MKIWHKFICFLLLFACLLLFLVSCQEQKKKHMCDGFAFDTFYSFTVYGPHASSDEDIQTELSRLELLFSATDESAVIGSFNQSTEDALLLSDISLQECLSDALLYAELTDGAFDFTLGELRELWNVADTSAALPSHADIIAALSHSGYEKISIDETVSTLIRQDTLLKIDLGAIAKGYVIHKMASMYKNEGASGGILDFGGTIAVFGEKTNGSDFTVGIRNPYNAHSSFIGYVTLPAKCDPTVISVSGLYERFKEVEGKVYTHIFDTDTGYPLNAESTDPDSLLSVAVISENGAAADALSTALLVMGKERALAFCNENADMLGFSALLYGADGSVSIKGNIQYTPIS